MKTIQKWNVLPKLIFLDQYYDHPGLIDAFYERAKQYPPLLMTTSYSAFMDCLNGIFAKGTPQEAASRKSVVRKLVRTTAFVIKGNAMRLLRP